MAFAHIQITGTPRPAAAAFMARPYPGAPGRTARVSPEYKKLLKRVSSACDDLEVLTTIGMFRFVTVDPDHIDVNIAPLAIAPMTEGLLYIFVDQVPPASKPTVLKRTLERLKKLPSRADAARLSFIRFVFPCTADKLSSQHETEEPSFKPHNEHEIDRAKDAMRDYSTSELTAVSEETDSLNEDTFQAEMKERARTEESEAMTRLLTHGVVF